jgi:hypothetical protein
MNKLILIIVALIPYYSIQSQCPGNAFSKTIGGDAYDQGHSVSLAPDGGYFLGGITESAGFGDKDFIIMKFNPNHSLQWGTVIGTTGVENGSFFCITSLSDGGVAFAGFKAVGNGNRQLIYGKLNSGGTLVWNKILEPNESVLDTPRAMAETSSGDIIIVGTCNQYIASSDGFFLRMDSSGNIINSEVYGQTYDDHFTGITELPNGNFAVYGSTEYLDATTTTDPMICIFNGEGELISTHVYTTPNSADQFTDLIHASDGFLYGTGYTGANGVDAFIMKIDANFGLEWAKNFGTSGTDRGSGIEFTEDGNILVSSVANVTSSSQEILVNQWNNAGQILWSKKFSFGGNDGMAFYGHPSLRFGSSNMLVIGFSDYAEDNSDMMLYMLDECGNNGCATDLIPQSSNLNTDEETTSLQVVNLNAISNGNLQAVGYNSMTIIKHCEHISTEDVDRGPGCPEGELHSISVYDAYGKLIFDGKSQEDYLVWKSVIQLTLPGSVYSVVKHYQCEADSRVYRSTEKIIMR